MNPRHFPAHPPGRIPDCGCIPVVPARGLASPPANFRCPSGTARGRKRQRRCDHPAQGCEERATLGTSPHPSSTPTGLHPLRRDGTPLGFARIVSGPRVDAPASHQPWAGRWNAVGVRTPAAIRGEAKRQDRSCRPGRDEVERQRRCDHPAQGCEGRATLGTNAPTRPTPTGLHLSRRP